MKPTTIVEVMGRAAQGRTSPYLCRGEDGVKYFVKNRALPPYQRVAEWLGATIAQALELPVAPSRLVCIPEELGALKVPWLHELGVGIGFGSEKQQAREFTMSDAGRLDTALAGRIAAFDWWIRNSDRNLSSRGGNANLLWRATAEPAGLIIIDHNLAFDPDFSAREFFDMHVFAPQFRALLGDFIESERVRQMFCDVRASLEGFWSTIPESWRYSDPECTIRATWAASDLTAYWAVATRPTASGHPDHGSVFLRDRSLRALCGNGGVRQCRCGLVRPAQRVLWVQGAAQAFGTSHGVLRTCGRGAAAAHDDGCSR